MRSDEDTFLAEDKDQDTIRAELSQMSFEDLQKLKEELGTKVYNEAIFGSRKAKANNFKRENKNRPREMPAKKPVPRFQEVIKSKKHVSRDPRFDSLCGTFNEKAFKNSYKFLTKLRENDLKSLKTELVKADDPKTIKKIKYLIQRLENQLREEGRHQLDNEKTVEEKKKIVEAIKHGEKPAYKKKSEKKVLNLVARYEQLKTSGKLKKHVQRLRKKNLQKDRTRLLQNAPSSISNTR